MLLFPYYAVASPNEENHVPLKLIPIILVVVALMAIVSIFYGWNYNRSSILTLGWVDLMGLMAVLIIQEAKVGWSNPRLGAISNLRVVGWLGITFFIMLFLISKMMGAQIVVTKLVVSGGLLFMLVPMIPSFLYFSRNYADALVATNEDKQQEVRLFLAQGILGILIVGSYWFGLSMGIYVGCAGYLLGVIWQGKITFLPVKVKV